MGCTAQGAQSMGRVWKRVVSLVVSLSLSLCLSLCLCLSTSLPQSKAAWSWLYMGDSMASQLWGIFGPPLQDWLAVAMLWASLCSTN